MINLSAHRPHHAGQNHAGARGASRAARRGFTLVEIMVVVVIISILAAITIPALQRVQRKAKVTSISNDFRVFAAAFDTYAQETGTWPVEVAAGAFPAVMVQRIKSAAWLRKTPMGGQYNWEYNQFNLFGTYKAAIAISATPSAPLPLDVNMLYDLEHTIDSPQTLLWDQGNFHLGTGIVPLFVIQP
jgi:prepilin-type N-terminal cleavage/methylation domain-containing protein